MWVTVLQPTTDHWLEEWRWVKNPIYSPVCGILAMGCRILAMGLLDFNLSIFLVFWGLCLKRTRKNGSEVRLSIKSLCFVLSLIATRRPKLPWESVAWARSHQCDRLIFWQEYSLVHYPHSRYVPGFILWVPGLLSPSLSTCTASRVVLNFILVFSRAIIAA